MVADDHISGSGGRGWRYQCVTGFDDWRPLCVLDSLPPDCFDRKSLYPVFIDSLNYFATDSLHYAALPIRRCQLENWARFSPQPPFSWALIISDKIIGFQSLSSFTFKIYLGPSSSFPPIFMCFNYFRQSSKTLCECLEDQLNVALKTDCKYFLTI